MTKEEQKAVEEFTEMNLTKKGLYHYDDMQDAFLIGLFKGEKMQPSLPSDLEEAADAYSENILANGEDMFDAIADGFRAGAEWMARQGLTKDGHVSVYDNGRLRVYTTILDKEDGIKFGDKVVVQIRKK